MADVNTAVTLMEVCEAAARSMKRDYRRGPSRQEGWRQQCCSTFNKFVLEVGYMKKKAMSSTWTDSSTFKERIDHCVAIHAMKLTPEQKNEVRCRNVRCMACGKLEEKNLTALSLFGYKNPKAFTSIDNLDDDFLAYLKQYDDVLEGMKSRPCKNTLPVEDGGLYLIGETCLARAKVAFMCSSLIPDMCMDAYLTAVERRQAGDPVCESKFYHTTPHDDVPRFMESFSELKRLCSAEVEDTDNFGVDSNYWSGVWNVRRLAAGVSHNKSKSLLTMLFKRASDHSINSELRSMYSNAAPMEKETHSARKRNEEEVLSDSESENDNGEVSSRKRRRHVRVDQESTCDSCKEEEESSKKPPSAKSHRDTIVEKLHELKKALLSEGRAEDALWVLEATVEIDKQNH